MTERNLKSGMIILSEDARHPFERLLKGWGRAVSAYIEQVGRIEAPYYFNERSNVSLLAAGAWIMKGVAVEEYPVSRSSADFSQTNGRCDLFISIDGQGAELEAKYFPYRRNETRDVFARQLKSKITEAVSAAATLPEYIYKRAGCVFYPVRIASAKRMSVAMKEMAIRGELEHYISDLRDNADIVAWCFPENARDIFLEADGDFYPGVVLAIKLVKVA
ncbi:hypothetical protein HFO58_10960 [Rhizobium leguminosarum]|uniref:hypothetical protein n=1 Tax=Rhizobium leguminosarum TaxID=384 RepID=UPI001C969198|nr:hypothetical protein [Rhizobium leguminosarum]MBY5533677.1 hypothetical protein [Rhizobium leguminosarum]